MDKVMDVQKLLKDGALKNFSQSKITGYFYTQYSVNRQETFNTTVLRIYFM